MGLSQTTAHYFACASFLFAAIWTAIFAIWWFRSRSDWKVVDMVKAASLVVFVLIVTPIMMWFSWPGALAQTPPQPPPISGNCNAVGNGNSNCSPTYNVAPQRLRLTDDLRIEILKTIPKSKPGRVVIIGATQDDQQVGFEIFNFMKQSGYILSAPDIIGQAMPMPNKPLTFSDGPSSWTLTIAPSAQ